MIKRQLSTKCHRGRIRLFVALISITVWTSATYADDVYNFYFQKAPGPQTVIQGGAPAKTTSVEEGKAQTAPLVVSEVPKTNENASVAQQPTVPALEAASDFKKWEVSVGYAMVADAVDQFKGGGVSVGYNFSRYFGTEAGAVYAKDAVHKYYEDNLGRSSLDYSAGLTVTPLHIHVFGADVFELGAIAGGMSTTSSEEPTKKKPTLFGGPRFAINFGSAIGIVGEARISQETRYGQAYAGLRIRL
jgi:hypothetical protein